MASDTRLRNLAPLVSLLFLTCWLDHGSAGRGKGEKNIENLTAILSAARAARKVSAFIGERVQHILEDSDSLSPLG
jgi:hypothetical protein